MEKIVIDRALLEQALEALAFSAPNPNLMGRHDAAEKALRAALEQEEQEQEPVKERDIAIAMLAAWCVAVHENGTGWDDWDEHYKDAAYRPGPLRKLLDAAIEAALKEKNHE